jgi:two-component system OmpR family sensor kinase
MTGPAAEPRRFRRLRRLSQRLPLRAKLMAALFLLTTVAVVGTAAAATAVLRTYLVDRVDGSLERYSEQSVPYMLKLDAGTATDADRPRLPTPYLLVTRDAAGREVQREEAQLDPQAGPRLEPLTLDEVRMRAGRPFDVPAQRSGEHGWRVRAIQLPDGGGSLTFALSLSEVEGTVSRLVRILFAVGLIVLLLITGLAYFIVRSSLRPLKEVESTAEAIAAGDLSRRVPDSYGRITEVGRLSVALNGMLSQIESAFGDREASASSARASEDRMRRFITDASHELRTPLTSIRGFAELYRQGAVSRPEQVPDLMRRIEEEAIRMGLLVEDLLLLARLDQHRPIELLPVDLVTIAADTVAAARAAYPARRIEVRMLDGDTDDLPGVLGDDARLRQIADNLVRNACTHTPSGTPIVVGVGSAVADDRTWALLQVADSGPGLSAEERERVFERFYRTDRSRARSTGGSGLGLSIVAALVAAHGGKVDVASTPGEGATFRVLLPTDAQPVPDPPSAPPAPAKPAPPAPTADHRPVRPTNAAR